MPSPKRQAKASQRRTGVLTECITHIAKHFDPSRYPNSWYAWCEFHGRLPLLSEKTGRPLKTKIFSSLPVAALHAAKYHKELHLQTEVLYR